MVPGILALLLMVMTSLLTSLAIVKEKEVGTLEQLVVTPIRSYQLLIGKIVPFVIIGFVDVTLVVLAAVGVFEVPLRGSIPLLYLLSGVFLISTLGLGLLVSTFSRTQQQAMMSAVFFVMMPMIVLSGFVFPIEEMPAIIQAVTYLLPLRYYFEIIRGIFLKGVGLSVLWEETLALLGLGLAILAVSLLRFRKRVD
jgi:ABC-2 type transport system permease protein